MCEKLYQIFRRHCEAAFQALPKQSKTVILSAAKNLHVDSSALPQDDTLFKIASLTSFTRNDDEVIWKKND